ncbi:MAG: hypothetical protein BGO10_04715 [Chlamydia sp. 32-24]|nr:MAG: hypothetical protein BGO10_04715 [Chlamydia sp. 32-24]
MEPNANGPLHPSIQNSYNADDNPLNQLPQELIKEIILFSKEVKVLVVDKSLSTFKDRIKFGVHSEENDRIISFLEGFFKNSSPKNTFSFARPILESLQVAKLTNEQFTRLLDMFMQNKAIPHIKQILANPFFYKTMNERALTGNGEDKNLIEDRLFQPNKDILLRLYFFALKTDDTSLLNLLPFFNPLESYPVKMKEDYPIVLSPEEYTAEEDSDNEDASQMIPFILVCYHDCINSLKVFLTNEIVLNFLQKDDDILSDVLLLLISRNRFKGLSEFLLKDFVCNKFQDDEFLEKVLQVANFTFTDVFSKILPLIQSKDEVLHKILRKAIEANNGTLTKLLSKEYKANFSRRASK